MCTADRLGSFSMDVVFRGSMLVENGALVAEPDVGQVVERAAFGQELLPAVAR
jgi:hypothetical protein